MAVASDGSYGIEKDLIFSFPVICQNSQWNIVKDIKLNEETKTALKETEADLLREREQVSDYL